MTAHELLAQQIATTGKMLEACFAGVSEEDADKSVPNAFSVRETISHLTEAYMAVKAHAEGGKHEWGSYQPADTSLAALKAGYDAARAQAAAAVAAADEATAVHLASDYIIGHDHYHIGQLNTLRLTHTPGFDPYAIYS